MIFNIKKKANQDKKKAVITILGMLGGDEKHNKAEYYFEKNKADTKDYYNTLPLLIEKYASKYSIVPIYTQEAKKTNEIVLQKSGVSNIDFDEKNLIEDDKDFDVIFKIIDEAIEEYDEIIVDVSHGFRHLPILMTVDLIIQNFQNEDKIKKILFAKEIEQYKLYEMIDLKSYLDLANISFILTSFEKNYTVANHIKVDKYKTLIEKLNNFSNDIMALSLNNLFQTTSKELQIELDKVKDVSIQKQAQTLKEKIKILTAYEGKKRYQTYYDLARDLFEKNYMLLSLSLLNESVRLYIKSTIKINHKNSVEKIEKAFNNDLYEIGNFFAKFKNDKFTYEQFQKSLQKNNKSKEIPLSSYEFNALKQAFPSYLLIEYKYKISFKQQSLIDAITYTRNNLAHGNVQDSFSSIQESIKELLNDYEKSCIKRNL